MWQAAFSSNSVLKNSSPLFEIGEECGTSATSPSRRAPSSVSSTLFSTSSPRDGLGLDDAAVLEAHLDVVDQRALVRQRLGADDMTLDAPRMRRGEHFLGRDVGVAGDAVLGGRGAALPFMAVGQPDRQIGARSGEVQRGEALAVQPVGALAQRGIVRLSRPRPDRRHRRARRQRSRRPASPPQRLPRRPGNISFAQAGLG